MQKEMTLEGSLKKHIEDTNNSFTAGIAYSIKCLQSIERIREEKLKKEKGE